MSDWPIEGTKGILQSTLTLVGSCSCRFILQKYTKPFKILGNHGTMVQLDEIIINILI